MERFIRRCELGNVTGSGRHCLFADGCRVNRAAGTIARSLVRLDQGLACAGGRWSVQLTDGCGVATLIVGRCLRFTGSFVSWSCMVYSERDVHKALDTPVIISCPKSSETVDTPVFK